MNVDRLKFLVEQAINTAAPLARHDEDGVRLSIQAIPPPAVEPNTTITLASRRAGPSTIHSSLFGLFHLQAGGDDAPFVSLGQSVEVGQKIGLIEAMKVFSPVISHRAGRIVAVLAEHGAEVECGQPLFHVE